MSHPIGAGGPTGAHPLDDDRHRRRGGWWWWLLAFLALLLIALLVFLLVRHFNGNDSNTAAKSATSNIAAPTSTAPAATPSPASTSTTAVAPGPVVAAASCIKPSLSVTPTSVHAGQTVTVVGRHFSGCHAATGNATPAVDLPVAVGVAGDPAVSKASTTARTTPGGYFKVTFVVPSAAAGNGAHITLAAASKDARTTLAYSGAARVSYRRSVVAGPTVGGGGMPTAVPAGTGGYAATSSHGDVETQLSILAGGLLLTAGGIAGLTRRRRNIS